MTRINFEDKKLIEPAVDELIEAGRSKPRKSKRKNRAKKIKLKSNCFLLLGMAFILFLIVIPAVIARTGIVEIPVFSQIFYRQPGPIRQIETKGIIPPGQNSSYDEIQKLFRLELTEEELTAMIRQGLIRMDDPIFAQNAQAVITSKEIEFFGLLLKPVTTNLTVRVKPYFKKDKFDYKLTQVKVGSLHLPPGIVDWAIKKYLALKSKGRTSGQQSLTLEQIEFYKDKIKPEGFELQAGKLIITLMIDLAALAPPVEEIQEQIQGRFDEVINVIKDIDPAELEKINNFDFDNLDPSTWEKFKEINITPEALEKFKNTQLDQLPQQ